MYMINSHLMCFTYLYVNSRVCEWFFFFCIASEWLFYYNMYDWTECEKYLENEMKTEVSSRVA